MQNHTLQLSEKTTNQTAIRKVEDTVFDIIKEAFPIAQIHFFNKSINICYKKDDPT